MKKIYSFFLMIFALSSTLSYAQSSIHGRQTMQARVTFSDMVAAYHAHPELYIDRTLPAVEPSALSRGILAEPESDMFLHEGATLASAIHPASSHSHSAYLPVSPAPLDTFLATTSNSLTVFPPDTHGAVDSQYCVSMVNTAVTIRNRAGVLVSSVPLGTFWASVVPNPPKTYCPRIQYDKFTGRWIVSALAYSGTDSSQLMVGASETNDPTGAWYLYAVRFDATLTNWLDFDVMGYNNQWIVLTGTSYRITTGASNGAVVYAFNKDSVLAGISAPYTRIAEATATVLAPVVVMDSGVNSMFLLDDNGYTTGKIRLWKMTGAVGTPAIATLATPTSPLPWQYQANAHSRRTIGADFAPQLGTANKIQCDDARIYNCVERNGSVWTSHNAFLPYSATVNATRCSIMWWQIDTVAGAVKQNGIIDDATNTNFYYFPSIAVNAENDVLLGYNTSSATKHPDDAYSLHMNSDPVDSMRPDVIYHHGLVTYYNIGTGTKNLWGHYSATCVDPKNDTDFYTIQECVHDTAGNYWDAWWAQVKLCITPYVPTITQPIICAGGAGTYTFSSTRATAFSYTVTGAGWVSTASTADTLPFTTAGTGPAVIKVAPSNACGSGTVTSFTVTPTPVPGTPTLTASPMFCNTAIDTFSAKDTLTTSYAWTVIGSGWSGTSTTDTLLANVSTGIGTVIVTASNACGIGGSATITANDPLFIPPTTPVLGVEPAYACFGVSSLFTVDSVPTALQYTWSVTGTGWSGTATTSDSINITAGTTIATVSVFASNSCSVSPVFTFTVLPNFFPGTPTVTAVLSLICNTVSATYVTAPDTLANSYSWTALGIGWSGTSTTDTFLATVAVGTGTIICAGVNQCGNGPSDTLVSTVIPTAVPLAPTGGVTPLAPCQGSVVMYAMDSVPTAASYTWSDTGAGWSAVAASTTDTITYNVGTGTAVVSVTATNICGTGPAYVFTVVPVVLADSPIVTLPYLNCALPTGIFTATAATAVTYQWGVGGTGWSGDGSTSDTATITYGTGTGIITCAAVNACGTGASSTIFLVSPQTTPTTPGAGYIPPYFCEFSTGICTVTPEFADSTYTWTVEGTGWSGSSTTDAIDLTVGTTIATITVTASNGCTTSLPYSFTIIPTVSSLPTPAISLLVLPCGTGVTAVLTTGSVGASSFAWTILGTGWSGFSSTGTIGVTVGTGIGTVIAVANNVCTSSLPDTFYVTPLPFLTPEATSITFPTPLCSGDHEVFSTPSLPFAASYEWQVTGSGWGGSSTADTINLTVGDGPATIAVAGLNACGLGVMYSVNVSPIHTPISSFSIENHVTNVTIIDTVKFTGTGYAATAYAWSFGSTSFASPGTGSGPQAVHWMSAGLKTLTLTVSDSGCSTSYVDTVLVLGSLDVAQLSPKNANFMIVPNPNSGSFNLEFDNLINQPFDVKMVDMLGREVYRNSFIPGNSNTLSINTDGLNAGNYIISVIVGNDVSAKTITIVK